jgi:hypothetical protein
MKENPKVFLTHPFKYHYEGKIEEAQFLTMQCYSMKQMDKVAAIKEIVMAAMGNFQNKIDANAIQDAREEQALQKESGGKPSNKKGENEEEEAKDGKELLSLVYMNLRSGDGPKLIGFFKKFLTSGVVAIDDSVTLTGLQIDDIHPTDFEQLMGDYIGNFILT